MMHFYKANRDETGHIDPENESKRFPDIAEHVISEQRKVEINLLKISEKPRKKSVAIKQNNLKCFGFTYEYLNAQQ